MKLTTPSTNTSFTKEQIYSLSHLPISLACLSLNLEIDVLKKRCRELGIKRWPYNARREMKKVKESKKVEKKDKKGFYEFHVSCHTLNKVEYITKDKPLITYVQALPSFSDFVQNVKLK